MSQRFSDRLQAFLEHWNQRVRAGQNSSMGNIEVMMLEVYDNWLRDYEKNKPTKEEVRENSPRLGASASKARRFG
jgi:hypothetical protein